MWLPQHVPPDWSRSETQTFDGWRGFRIITTQTGTAPDPVTKTVDTHFQGLSKNCAASSCPSGTPVTLTSSRGTTADDSNGYAGMTFEEITYNDAGTGSDVTDTTYNSVGTYPAPGGTTTSSYVYDKAGHLTSVTGGQNRAYTWNDSGQLTQDAVTPAGGSAQDSTYIYGASGSLLLETDPTHRHIHSG